MITRASPILSKARNRAHILRNDGLSCMAYTEQFTFLCFPRMAESPQAGGAGRQVPGQSQEPRAQSLEPGAQSQELIAQSQDPDGILTTEGLPQPLRAAIAALSPRPKEGALRSVIRDMCLWRPLTSTRLAGLLNRRQDSLVRDHLKPMVEAGELSYTIPEMPNHPSQAYTVPSEESTHAG
jgi:hypothetical protein